MTSLCGVFQSMNSGISAYLFRFPMILLSAFCSFQFIMSECVFPKFILKYVFTSVMYVCVGGDIER